MAGIERRNLEPVLPLAPCEPGLRAHVLRVAALAARAAEYCGHSSQDVESIEWAGVLHHHPVDLADAQALDRLFADLHLEVPAGLGPLPERAAAIVLAFRGVTRPEGRALAQAAALLESANLFDEQMENLPYEDLSTTDAIEELLGSGVISADFSAAVRSFRSAPPETMAQTARKLPVFPKAALQALRITSNPDPSILEIERTLARDPVLSGEIVQLANSGAFGSSYAVSSLGAALSRIGILAAGKLIATAAMRRCFASSSLHALWAHSAGTADAAAALAADSGKIEIGSAYLAGLVHDIGRLAYELSPAAADVQTWLERGFPVVYAEYLVSGTDHAVVGADILASWNFPATSIDAIRFHHRPELSSSRLASLIYAADESNESLPSLARDHLAAKRLDICEIRPLRAAG